MQQAGRPYERSKQRCGRVTVTTDIAKKCHIRTNGITGLIIALPWSDYYSKIIVNPTTG